jgi:hypothetical protein
LVRIIRTNGTELTPSEVTGRVGGTIPTSCLNGTRSNEFTVDIRSGERVNVSTNGVSQEVNFSDQRAPCSGNQPPVCNLNLQGSAVRTGGITTFSVDASQSRDPDSVQPLEFGFSVNCRDQIGQPAKRVNVAPDLDDRTTPQREVTVGDPSDGVSTVTCTVTVTPRDVRGGESSCTVSTILRPYSVGCDGKLYDPPGTEPKIDSCGVCGGTDSCGVRTCTSKDHRRTQLNLDSGAHEQRAFGIGLAWRLPAWGGRTEKMKALRERFRAELQAAYVDAWQSAYQLPSVTLSNCGDTILCSSVSTAPAVSAFIKKSQRFVGIHQRIIKALQPFLKTAKNKKEAAYRAKSLKNAAARSLALHQDNIDETKDFPETNSECRG